MVKFGLPSISSLTLSFVKGIMGRKEGHYSGGPQHMLKPCTKTHSNTHTHRHWGKKVRTHVCNVLKCIIPCGVYFLSKLSVPVS